MLRCVSTCLGVPLLLLACASGRGASGPVTRLADGGYRLACKSEQPSCLERAALLCKGDGYFVASAHERSKLLGHDQGQSQIKVDRSDAVVYCGERDREPPPAIRLERPISEAAAEAAPAASPAARACVPGATQACVGPGGCSGGQACSADGSRFGACDCGAPAAAAAPTSPSP